MHNCYKEVVLQGGVIMPKRLSFTVACAALFVVVSLGIGQDVWMSKSSSTFAEEVAKKCACKYGCSCEHCRGKSLECPCGKEKKASCEKCRHEKCPTDCNKCPDCALEKHKKRPSGY